MSTKLSIFLTTFESEKDAEALGLSLLEKQLAACVSVLPACKSLYVWENKVCKATEYLMIIKTEASKASELKETVLEQHPYEVPELIEINAGIVHQDYANWFMKQLGI